MRAGAQPSIERPTAWLSWVAAVCCQLQLHLAHSLDILTQNEGPDPGRLRLKMYHVDNEKLGRGPVPTIFYDATLCRQCLYSPCRSIHLPARHRYSIDP